MPCDHLTTMDPPLFVNHYRALFSGMRLCGLATPWIPKPPSLTRRLPYLLWDTWLVVIVVYMLWCYVYSIMTTFIEFQDICSFGISSSNYILGLLLTFYYITHGDKLKKVTTSIDAAAEAIMKHQIGEAELFHQLYLKNSKLMNFFTSLSVSMNVIHPIFYFWTGPISALFAGNYRAQIPLKINSPFEDRRPGVYEFLVFTMMCCVASSVVKKAVTDCLFLSLFRIQKDFLRYLSISMKGLQKEFLAPNNVLVEKKFILWISLHQQVMKNIQELIEAYSPVIVFNYISLISNFVCAAFIITMKDNDNFFQPLAVFLYAAFVTSYLYLIFDTAHHLTIEVEELSLILYSLPWYEMKKVQKDMIKLVLKVSNSNIQVTAYRSPIFLLNRETFAKFMTSTMSAFVTFCQIKETYDQ